MGTSQPKHAGPALLCFDGSDDAAEAIARAGPLITASAAVVLTVWEPLEVWEPYDPGAILGAGIARLASPTLGLDDIAADVAREKAERGLATAQSAGFSAQARIARGKTWRAICDVGDDLDASVIVLGARGISRVESVLLGSVSASVLTHACRPVLIVPRDDRERAFDEAGGAA